MFIQFIIPFSGGGKDLAAAAGILDPKPEIKPPPQSAAPNMNNMKMGGQNIPPGMYDMMRNPPSK